MALKTDSETLTKELKAAQKAGRNFIYSPGSTPEKSYFALSKKKIPQSEKAVAQAQTKKKPFLGTCFKSGPTFVFETSREVTPELGQKLVKTIKAQSEFKPGKLLLRTNLECAEGESGEHAGAPTDGGKSGKSGGGGGKAAVEEPVAEKTTSEETTEPAQQAAEPGPAKAAGGGPATKEAPAGDANPFTGQAAAAGTAPSADVDTRGKTPKQVLKELRKRIDELHAWGDKKSGKLRKDAKAIEDGIEAGAADVDEKLTKLRKNLEPVYENYLEQRKAKQKYDKQFPKLKRAHEALVKVGSYVPTFEPTLGDVADRMAALEKKADAKDFVAALDLVPGLEKEIRRVTDDASEAVQMMIEYETRMSLLAPRLSAAGEPTVNEQAKKLQESIQTRRDEMQEAFDRSNYGTALDVADELEIDLARVETILADVAEEKARYEARRGELEPRVTKAREPVVNAGLAERQKEILELFAEAKETHEAGDHGDALYVLDEVAESLASYEERLTTVAADKEKYEAQARDLAPRIEAVTKSSLGGPVADARKSLLETKSDIEKLVAAGDYSGALINMSVLEATLAIAEAYTEEVTAFEAKYREKLAVLQPRIDAAAETLKSAPLEKLQGEIAALVREMEKLAAADDFEKALNQMTALEIAIAKLETGRKDLDEEKAEYERRYAELKPRWAKAAHPVRNESLTEDQEGIAETRTEIEAAAAAGDYDTALRQLDEEAVGLTWFEQELARHAALAKEYTSRMRALRSPLDKVATADVAALAGLAKNIESKEGDAKDAFDEEEYAEALAVLDWLEPAVQSFLEEVAAHGDGSIDFKKEYDERIKGVQKRRKTASKRVDRVTNERATEHKKEVQQIAEKMEKFASDGLHEQAYPALMVLDAELDALESLLTKLSELETEYATRFAALEPDLDRIAEPAKNEKVVKGQESFAEDRETMEQAAADGDHESAVAALDKLAPMVPAFLEYLADIEAERAEYEKRLGDLAPRLREADHPVKGTETTSAAVKDARKKMEEAAAADDFDEALTQMDELEMQLAALEQQVAGQRELQVDYEKRRDLVLPSYEESRAELLDASLKERQEEIATVWKEMEEAAGKGDYRGAIVRTISVEAWARALAAERKRYEADKAEFEKRWAALEPRVTTLEANMNPDLMDAEWLLPKAKERVDSLLSEGNYTEGLDALADLEAETTSGERELDKVRAWKEQYDRRFPGVAKRVEAAAKPVVATDDEETGIEQAEEFQERIAELDGALRSLASGEDWATGLEKLDQLEAELNAFDVLLDQIRRRGAGGDSGSATPPVTNPFG